MKGLTKYWWAIPLAIMTLLVALIFRPELRGAFGKGANGTAKAPTGLGEASPEAVPASLPAGSAALASAGSASAGSVSAASASAGPLHASASASGAVVAPARPAAVDGKDATTWRRVLRGAVDRRDAAIAAEAFVALATIDPERFAERKVLEDAVAAAHLAAAAPAKIAQPVFDMLGGDTLGSYGPDVLYRLTSIHGGSRAAKMADALLQREDVLARGTPAMRIALAIRAASCNERPALFERAGADGDERTLYLLQTMRSDGCGQISCCMKGDASLSEALGHIRARLAASRESASDDSR